MLEHVLQTYQAYALRSQHAHGLLGQYFDTDFLHLAFNATLLVALLPIARQRGNPGDLRWQLFIGGLGAASYHVVEHSIKTYQSVMLGHDPALGILGNFGPLIPIHLWLNLVVYVLVTPHLVASVLRWRRGQLAVPPASASRSS